MMERQFYDWCGIILSVRGRTVCPVLDNPGRLTDIVEKSGTKSTDYQNLESAKEFSDKCVDAAANWTPVADRLWMASKGAACEGCYGCRQ